MQPYIIVPAGGSEPADEWFRLGVQAHTENKLPQAQQHYLTVLRIDPTHARAMLALAIVYAQSNLLHDALATVERASMLDPTIENIWSNWCLIALECGRLDDALAAGRKGVDTKRTSETRLALAMALPVSGFAEDAITLLDECVTEATASAIPPHLDIATMSACFVRTLAFRPPSDALAARRRWYDRYRHQGPTAPHANAKTTDRPLRVGYVSGDFKRHSAAMIFGNVLLKHDPAVVEMYLYSTLPVDPQADTMTQAFVTAAGPRWRSIVSLDDEAAAAMIREDRIDILVDLTAHTNGCRLALFTRKPAPVQVTAWGFAHGTGLTEMDYFVADPVAVPEDERQHYAEHIWDLPCIVSYLEPEEYKLKGTSKAPFRKDDDGWLTFGVFSRFEKLSERALTAYADILRRIPESRLLFKDAAFQRPYSVRRAQSFFADIAPDRVRYMLASPHPDHMSTYQQVDLVLDPFPHGGGTAALEQLYMGVPILTLYGVAPAGRTTSSVYAAMGGVYKQFVTRSEAEYVERAVELASDEGRKTLAAVRKTLREDFLGSPVVAGYREAVESAYRDMWSRWCRA